MYKKIVKSVNFFLAINSRKFLFVVSHATIKKNRRVKKKLSVRVIFFRGKSVNYKMMEIEGKKKQCLQYVCNVYNCQFHTVPHSGLNDGTPSRQSTKYSVWPPISWDSGNIT